MTDLNHRLWRRARRYIAQNQPAPARVVLESLLARDPDDTLAHLLLGALYAREDKLCAETAQALAAARKPPDDPVLLGDLIAALLKVGEVVAARCLLDSPVMSESDAANVLMRAAIHRQLTGEYGAALALINRANAVGAEGRDFHFCRGVQLSFNGDMDGAREAFERCIAFEPPSGRAFLQLARLHRQTAEFNHLDLIDAALTRVAPTSEDCTALEFARYKELEDLQRHDEAWHALARGNALMYARSTHDSAREAALFDRLIQSCSAGVSDRERISIDAGPQPIFVLGMPRSGTTVLERILGGHSRVESAGELSDFPRALAWATDHRPSGMLDETTLARLDQVNWAELGRMYLAQTRWRAHGKPFFVDKLPCNWMLAGLIHRALPRAKILHIVRTPMDVCFSNWRAYFGDEPEFAYSYDLAALAAHHRQYSRVMAHWRKLLPGAMLDVNYTQLVREPEPAARRSLEFCGLAYEPGCVDLTHNTTPIATLSVSQARQPIHAHAFGEWQPYATQLEPLRYALSAT